MEERYNHVRKVLKEKFKKVFSSEKFEDSWTEIANLLKIDIFPKLNSNQADKDYNKVAKYEDLSEDFKFWHRGYNRYDYLLYEEFCT